VEDREREEWCTRRGFMRRRTSFSHCLHLVVRVLAKMGTPQLRGMLVSIVH